MKMLSQTLSSFLLLGLLVLPAHAKDQPAKASSVNMFATSLYAQLSRVQGNIFISPDSISEALNMTLIGAQGPTATSIAETLKLPNVLPTDPKALATHIQNTKQARLLKEKMLGPDIFKSANALWVDMPFSLNQEYVDKVKDGFDASVKPLDFTNETASREKINKWVSDKTNKKIENLVDRGMLSSGTPLVLTNAAYFKAGWLTPFNKKNTQSEKFYLNETKTIMVDMLKQTGHYNMAELDGFKILVLPYKNKVASMIVLLPDRASKSLSFFKKSGGMANLEKQLTAENLSEWIKQTSKERVDLTLPKFKATSTLDMKAALSAAGMSNAFTQDADFTGITAQRPFYIEKVLHKAFIDVDEQGTEAAAATAVTMTLATADTKSEEAIPFIVDRPFIYIIRANHNGDILFMGRMTDPSDGKLK